MPVQKIACLLMLLGIGSVCTAQPQRQQRLPDGVVAHRNLSYITENADRKHQLDLYLPAKVTDQMPLFIWIHGGGWRNGSKNNINRSVSALLSDGYAIASLDYRLDGLDKHPNHIHDCHAAIRWLVANSKKYGYNTDKMAVGGSSAGGHLALLVGMTTDVPAMQGKLGDHLDATYKFKAIVDFYGPFDLYALGQAKSHGQETKVTQAFSQDASPASYLDASDPPVLIFHGMQDRVVVPEQSITLDKMCKALGIESELHLFEDAKHGGPAFSNQDITSQIKTFLNKHLDGKHAK